MEYLNRAVPGALTEVPAALVAAMPVNEKDRHVLALAVHVGAPTIVTENTRDFPSELLDPLGVGAVTADAFALAQVDLHPEGVRASLAAMAARRRRYPKTPDDIVESLVRYLPSAMEAVRRRP
jgi:hypothetical protein